MSDPIAALVRVLERGPATFLTGAGCSTDSGIPDYRGAVGRLRTRRPVQHQAFVSDPSARSRYWARSRVGWPRFRDFQPNAAHHALVGIEQLGALTGLITQNVDRLHTKAGARAVIELHGALADVRCLGCGARSDRDSFQERLADRNPALDASAYEIAPDGDVDLPDAVVAGFCVPECALCGGVLMPDVVFFGGTVPKPRVDAAFDLVDRAHSLVVAGSSLAVFSGYRYVLRAASRGIPIAIVNLGETRADSMAEVRVNANVTEVLPALARAIGGTEERAWVDEGREPRASIEGPDATEVAT